MPSFISVFKSARCLAEKEVAPLGETELFLASSIYNPFQIRLQASLFCIHFSNSFLNLSASLSPLKREYTKDGAYILHIQRELKQMKNSAFFWNLTRQSTNVFFTMLHLCVQV